MNFQFTNPGWLLLLLVAAPWMVWLTLKSDVQISTWRRWTAFGLRMVIVLALILAIAGLQWKRPQEGMNVFFLLDRSDSIPPEQQEAARLYVSKASALKKPIDKAGVLAFGTDAAIDTSPNEKVGDQKIQAVVGSERTDVASAIRLGTAAFPETGQKRLVLLSDGNENVGDAFAAVVAARPLGVTVDVVPLGVARGGDVSVQKLSLPANIKRGQTFEVKIFAQADQPQRATVEKQARRHTGLAQQPLHAAVRRSLEAAVTVSNPVEVFAGIEDAHEKLPGRRALLRLQLTHGEIGTESFAVVSQRDLELRRDRCVLRARVAPRRQAPAED